jgi:hypothetical protein
LSQQLRIIREVDLGLVWSQPRQHRPLATGRKLLNDLGQRNSEMVRQPLQRGTRLKPHIRPYTGKIAVPAEMPRYIAGLAVPVALTAQRQSFLSRWLRHK